MYLYANSGNNAYGWGANANLKMKSGAAHQISDETLATIVSLLRSNADSVLGGNADVRIPDSNSGIREPRNAYSPVTSLPHSDVHASNSNSNASLIS
jgi:hypothetical protein